MLGKIDLKQSLDKREYKREIKILDDRLNALQQRMQELDIPVCVVFEGWSSSGKGTLISKVLYPLDPRYVNVYSLNRVTEDQIMRPVLWHFWNRMPSKGRMTIFDKSWHRIILPEGIEKWDLSKKEVDGFFYDINAFEKMHQRDGTLIIKIFLHISKEEQKKRFKELDKNDDTKWRVNQKDISQNENYDKYVELFQNMIQKTNSVDSQWTIVEANNKRFATIKVLKTIISRIEEQIHKKETEIEKSIIVKNSSDNDINPKEISILSGIDVSKDIDDDYKNKIEKLQEKIKELEYKLYTKRKSVVMVFEGWDAAGKGGSIKRITEEMDPRGYEVIPVAAPTKEELSHHYLWRFSQKLPKDGHIAIFDRSWYGRVMVERIEGFCTKDEWNRAYREINDMEKHLDNHGTIIFKFWLQIDKEEQLSRFNDRQADPLKRYKITDEDWRNREKWDEYEVAIDEMLMKTNTEHAPWVIVESNNKKYARMKILNHVVNELEKQLKDNK